MEERSGSGPCGGLVKEGAGLEGGGLEVRESRRGAAPRPSHRHERVGRAESGQRGRGAATKPVGGVRPKTLRQCYRAVRVRPRQPCGRRLEQLHELGTGARTERVGAVAEEEAERWCLRGRKKPQVARSGRREEPGSVPWRGRDRCSRPPGAVPAIWRPPRSGSCRRPS
jgi:hypothetical protein